MILSAIACVLVMHQADGSSSVDILANSSRADPKLGVPLLLVIQFYNHIFSTNTSVDSHGVLVNFSLLRQDLLAMFIIASVFTLFSSGWTFHFLDSSRGTYEHFLLGLISVDS